jgi:LEA14-like dessication related protein
MKRIAVVAAAVGVGYLIWRKITPSAPLGIKLLFNGVRLSSGKIMADFKASNPTPVSSTIQAMQGTLLVNGNSLGPLTGFSPVTVPPSSVNTTFSCTVPVSLTNAITDIADLIAGNTGTPAVFQVDGLAAVDQRVLPLDLTYQIV